MTDISVTNDNYFVPPNIAHVRATSACDILLITKLIESFRKKGIIAGAFHQMKPVDDLNTMFTEAALAARPEELSNPEFYRSEVEKLVADRELYEGDTFINPMLTYDDEPDLAVNSKF